MLADLSTVISRDLTNLSSVLGILAAVPALKWLQLREGTPTINSYPGDFFYQRHMRSFYLMRGNYLLRGGRRSD